MPRPALRRARGFTLIELMVAIAIMALLAALSWRGLDAMSRAQALTQARSDAVLSVQAGLQQWRADLDAMAVGVTIQSLDWDGRVFRLTRYGSAAPGQGLYVVAWAWRSGNVLPAQGDAPDDAPDAYTHPAGYWLRWQSAELRTVDDWQQAWSQATVWAQNAGPAQRRLETPVFPLQQWRLYYYRNDGWSNPLSSEGQDEDAPATPAAPGGGAGNPLAGPSVKRIPEGIRAVLTLPPDQPLAGALTLDWVSPVQGGGKL